MAAEALGDTPHLQLPQVTQYVEAALQDFVSSRSALEQGLLAETQEITHAAVVHTLGIDTNTLRQEAAALDTFAHIRPDMASRTSQSPLVDRYVMWRMGYALDGEHSMEAVDVHAYSNLRQAVAARLFELAFRWPGEPRPTHPARRKATFVAGLVMVRTVTQRAGEQVYGSWLPRPEPSPPTAGRSSLPAAA